MVATANDFHCPSCSALPHHKCIDTPTTHLDRYGNDWQVVFGDVHGYHKIVYCYDRKTRDMVAAALTTAGMTNVSVSDRMVRRKNLLGGWFIEAEDTPLHLSPASETYHSM